MKIEELLKTEISYYGNVKYNKAYKTITLYEWITKYSLKNKRIIELIRDEYNKDKKKAKKMKSDNLPCVTITGVFESYRREELVTKINPIIAIDIDRDDNPTVTDWNELKMRIANLPYVFLTSYSCSGKGLYCLVYYNTELDFDKMFNALEQDFKEIGIVIDKNCKDITRLRFISYDDNILIRKGEIEQYNKEKEDEIKDIKEYNDSQMNETDSFIYKAIYHLIMVDNYRANSYESWLQNGFLLGTFGDKGYILFMLLSQLSDNYNREDAIKKFQECQNKTRYTKAALSYYFALLKNKYGKDWKNTVINAIL